MSGTKIGSEGSATTQVCQRFVVAISVFATLECELLRWQTFRTQTQAWTALFDHIEGFYNSHRRYSTIGYCSPAAYEEQYQMEAAA